VCDDPLANARDAFARGDFAQAHRRFAEAREADVRRHPPDLRRAPTVAEIQSAALGRDFGAASALTVQLANAWYPGPEASERQRLLCVADAYASRVAGARASSVAGIPVGVLKKPRRADGWCNYLAADLAMDREARMWRLQCDDDDYDTRRLLFVEAGERGAYFAGSGETSKSYVEDYPLGALYDPSAWIAKRHIELEGSIATASDAGGGAVAYELLAQAALFRAVVGERDAARRFLVRLDKPGGDRTSYILGAIAAVYIGDPRQVERMLELGQNDSNSVGVIRRSVLPLLRAEPTAVDVATEPWNAAILTALGAHDAEALAKAFADGRTHRYEALRVRATFTSAELAPLRKWLREKFPVPAWNHGVWAVGLRLADQLALAEAFDDAELCRLLRPRVAAFAAAIAARTPTTPRNDDPTFVNDLLERSQDKPAEVWRMHH
jgi:hypothetical protein